jgi:hypothetical protein
VARQGLGGLTWKAAERLEPDDGDEEDYDPVH